MDDDRTFVESGAEMTLLPHEPFEFEKLKHQLTHSHFNRHRRTESAKHACENTWLRHVHSCRDERPNRHVRNSVGSKMLNIHGLADIILQCDPEPSFIK